MAGVHSGVEKRILDLNPSAVFVPCNSHSPNLVGVHAAHVNVRALTFFGTVERLFGYFSCSTHRLSVLKDFVNITVKRHSDSRWSSKAAAVNAISRQLEKVIAALEQLCDTLTKMLDTREDAALLLNGIEKFEFVALLFFWPEVFSSIDRIKKCLQAKETTFHQALNQLGTLIDLIDNWKNELCARAISDDEDIKSRKVQFEIFDQCGVGELICHQMKVISGSDCDFFKYRIC
jgi:hypothetical protein